MVIMPARFVRANPPLLPDLVFRLVMELMRVNAVGSEMLLNLEPV